MPVANKQIEELYGIFRKYLSQTAMLQMLRELQETDAYRTNKSFEITIDRLVDAHPVTKEIISGSALAGNGKAGLNLVPGHRYRITHKSTDQKIGRYSIMDYLGPDHDNPENLNFSARPMAGTQSMPKRWIISVREVPKSTAIAINKIARVSS